MPTASSVGLGCRETILATWRTNQRTGKIAEPIYNQLFLMKRASLLFLIIGHLSLLTAQEIRVKSPTAETALITEGGIQFIHEQFTEALNRAKTENKLIFMDAYTTWCGPCKAMARTTFTDVSVANLYNEKFINLKLDMEKGDGPTLLQRYNILAFPTLLFLNADGEVVHKALGYHDVQQFLDLGKTALNGEMTLAKWTSRYDKGERDPQFLKDYTKTLADAFDDRRFAIAETYLATQKNWNTPENLSFIYQYAEKIGTKMFDYLVKNPSVFEKKLTKDEVELKIQGVAQEFLFNEQNLPTLAQADSVIQLVTPPAKVAREIKSYRLKYYRMKGDRTHYALSAIDYFKKYRDDAAELSETATTFYEQIEEPKFLTSAVKWAKKATKLDKRFMNQIVVAQLYQKLNKPSKSLKAAEKAIDIAKTNGENYDEATALIAELKKK
jgi:thiol-disulfide isomerase/thioredoxin